MRMERMFGGDSKLRRDTGQVVPWTPTRYLGLVEKTTDP